MVVLSRLSIVVPTLLAEQLVDTSSVGDITLGSMTHSVIAIVQSTLPALFAELDVYNSFGVIT